jgi:hypothetical protein
MVDLEVSAMLDLQIVGIVAVLLLSLFLYYRATGGPRPTQRHQPAGTPIDTSPIASRIAAVRQNPVAAFEAKAVRKSRRSMLIAAARGAIRNLPFFHSREHEHQT